MEFYKLFHNRTDFINLYRWARIANNSLNIDEYMEMLYKGAAIDAVFNTEVVKNVAAYFTIGREN